MNSLEGMHIRKPKTKPPQVLDWAVGRRDAFFQEIWRTAAYPRQDVLRHNNSTTSERDSGLRSWAR